MSEQDHTEALAAAKIAVEAAEAAKQAAQSAASSAERVANRVAEVAQTALLTSQDMNYIKRDLADIKSSLDNKYVTKEEFSTVKSIAY